MMWSIRALTDRYMTSKPTFKSICRSRLDHAPAVALKAGQDIPTAPAAAEAAALAADEAADAEEAAAAAEAAEPDSGRC